MRQLPKKLTALLAAAALCLAAPVGALADGPSVLYTFAEEYQAALSEPLEIATFEDDGTAAAATVSTEGNETKVEETGYYTVTIPATVSVSDASQPETFKLSGTLQPYRKLTIDVSTANADANGDHLKCGTATLPYTLSASSSDNSLTVENNGKKYTAESDATKKDFSANLSVKLATDVNPSVSGEYIDTLTFTMACEKKTYTVVYDGNGADGTGTMDNSTFDCGESATLAENKYTRSDYHFAGWSTEESPATFDALYADKASVDALTTTAGETVILYAQWGYKYTVNVHYEDVEGNFQEKDIVKYSKILKEGAIFEWNQASQDVWGDLTEEQYNKRWQTAVKNATATTKEDASTISETVGGADKNFDVYVLRQRYYIDLNGRAIDENGNTISGIGGGNIRDLGKAKIYINGSSEPIADNNGMSELDDYFIEYPYGTTFRAEVVEGTVAKGYVVSKYEYNSEEKVTGSDGKEWYVLTGSGTNQHQDGEKYHYNGVTIVFKQTSATGTGGGGTTAQQSLTITDTMRDYFAAIETGDDSAADSPAEDAEDAEDADSPAETPETAPEDGYDGYDDYVADEYPVVFFETE